jgi:hypothetical protein
MTIQLNLEFEEVLEPFGDEAAAFFLAAGLYHSGKVSFSKAAHLAGLGFDAFLHRPREHFGRGFEVADESVLEDIELSRKIQPE